MDQVHFNGSVPEAYLHYLQPLLFDPFSPLMAQRVWASGPKRVLELACGTGSLTVELAKLGVTEIVATDLQASMIEVARRELVSQDPTSPVFEVADAQDLPYGDATFDSVACQFGYMFFPDKSRALGEAHRVLEPSGHLHLLIWEPLEMNEIAQIAHDVIVPILPEGTPRPFAGPFGFSDRETLSSLLNEEGFAQIRFEQLRVTREHPDPIAAARAFCRGTPISQDLGDRTTEAELELAKSYANRFEEMRNHVLVALYVGAQKS